MGQLADWECHKVVKAGKILRPAVLRQNTEGHSTGAYDVTVSDVNGAALKVECPMAVFSRGFPNVGDYLVIYEDGYKSWSPANAFEDGYTRKDALA